MKVPFSVFPDGFAILIHDEQIRSDQTPQCIDIVVNLFGRQCCSKQLILSRQITFLKILRVDTEHLSVKRDGIELTGDDDG